MARNRKSLEEKEAEDRKKKENAAQLRQQHIDTFHRSIDAGTTTEDPTGSRYIYQHPGTKYKLTTLKYPPDREDVGQARHGAVVTEVQRIDEERAKEDAAKAREVKSAQQAAAKVQKDKDKADYIGAKLKEGKKVTPRQQEYLDKYRAGTHNDKPKKPTPATPIKEQEYEIGKRHEDAAMSEFGQTLSHNLREYHESAADPDLNQPNAHKMPALPKGTSVKKEPVKAPKPQINRDVDMPGYNFPGTPESKEYDKTVRSQNRKRYGVLDDETSLELRDETSIAQEGKIGALPAVKYADEDNTHDYSYPRYDYRGDDDEHDAADDYTLEGQINSIYDAYNPNSDSGHPYGTINNPLFDVHRTNSTSGPVTHQLGSPLPSGVLNSIQREAADKAEWGYPHEQVVREAAQSIASHRIIGTQTRKSIPNVPYQSSEDKTPDVLTSTPDPNERVPMPKDSQGNVWIADMRYHGAKPVSLKDVEHPPGVHDPLTPSEDNYVKTNSELMYQGSESLGREHWYKFHASEIQQSRFRNASPRDIIPPLPVKQSAKDRIAARDEQDTSSGVPMIPYKGKNHFPPGTEKFTRHEEEIMANGSVSPLSIESYRRAALRNSERRAQREERKQGMGSDYNANHIDSQKAVRKHMLAPTTPQETQPKEENMATIDPTAQSAERRKGRSPRRPVTPVTPGGMGKTQLPTPDVAATQAPKGFPESSIDSLIAGARKQPRRRTPVPAMEAPQAAMPRTGVVPPPSSPQIRQQAKRTSPPVAPSSPETRTDIPAAKAPAATRTDTPKLPVNPLANSKEPPTGPMEAIPDEAPKRQPSTRAKRDIGSYQDVVNDIHRGPTKAALGTVVSGPRKNTTVSTGQPSQEPRLPWDTGTKAPAPAPKTEESGDVQIHGYVKTQSGQEHTHVSHMGAHYTIPSDQYERAFPTSASSVPKSHMEHVVSSSGGRSVSPGEVTQASSYEPAERQQKPSAAEVAEREHLERRRQQQSAPKKSSGSPMWPGVDVHGAYIQGGLRRVAVSHGGLSYGVPHEKFEQAMTRQPHMRPQGEEFHSWAVSGKSTRDRANYIDMKSFGGEKGIPISAPHEDIVLRGHLARSQAGESSSKISYNRPKASQQSTRTPSVPSGTAFSDYNPGIHRPPEPQRMPERRAQQPQRMPERSAPQQASPSPVKFPSGDEISARSQQRPSKLQPQQFGGNSSPGESSPASRFKNPFRRSQ